MTLPRPIDEVQTDNLIFEMFEHYQKDRANLFPSDEWFDEAWIHEPTRRERLRTLFSCIVDDFEDRVKSQNIDEWLKLFNYKKIKFSKGYVLLSH